MALNDDGLNIIITGDASQVIKEIEATEKAIENVKGSQVKITADSSQAVSEAEKVVNVVDSVNDGHIEITADNSQAVDAVDKVADATDSIQDVHADITADSSQAVSEAEKVIDVVDSINNGHIDITADGSQAIDEAGKASDALDNIQDVHADITADGSQAVEEMNKIHDVIVNINGRVVKFTVEPIIKDINSRLHDINSKFLNAGRKSGRDFASGASQEIDKGVNNIEKSLNRILAFEVGAKISAGFGSIFTGITSVLQRVTRVISSLMRNALAVGGGFEAQMTTVKVISGATGDELDKLTKKAREMGATLPITAKDAATAMTVLAQRGTSVKDILASVSDVANLAIAQGVSMGAAADLLGSTLTNFGIAMDDAAKVTAIFNNASNQSALNMSKLTEALKYVGPTAGSLGMELTEAVAAMEALANSGLTGEMTGTGLAMVLTKLATKSRIMGVETKDLHGKMRPLADIFSELRAKGFSLVEATAEFGARGRLAALNLAKLSDTLRPAEQRLKDYGSTQAAVDEKAKTFNNTMAAFRSAMEALHIEIFEQIKSQSKGVAAGFTEIVRALSDWVGKTKIAEKALNAFLEGLGFNIPSGADFKKFLDQIDTQAFVEKVKSFGSNIKGIADSIVSFISNIKTPLLFLIEHLDTFATISFWGWITGKAIQIPAIILSLAEAFIQLGTAIKSLSIANLTALASHPALLALGAAGYATYKAVSFSDAASHTRFETQKEAQRYLREQIKADNSLEWDIKLNVKTGFEKLPESWTKASDELREKVNQDIALLQQAFRDNVGKAIEAVTAKFPEMADALHNSAEVISNSSLRAITLALQGNKEQFDALPPHLQKVTQELYFMHVQAGQTVGSIDKIIRSYIELNKTKLSSNKPQNEVSSFARELSTSINSLFDGLPDSLERMKKFLGNQNIDLAVNLSLSQAQKQISELAKSLALKFNLPQDIVSANIFSSLQKLADKGNKTALSLVNGWNSAGNSLDVFLQSAQDAITYLGMSPEKFTPALNSLSKSIQKIDPLTGKVTEQFKKAYNALKQWSNITFDQLSQRIRRLRQAVEGGFIDKSALEKEAKNALKQIKVQVITDLQPIKDSFQSQSAYYSTVASEVFNRASEMGGETFIEVLRSELQGYSAQSGEAMGRAFVRQAEDGLRNIKSTLNINGVDMSHQGTSHQGELNFSNLASVVTDSVKPFVLKLEQLGTTLSSSEHDFSGVTTAINKLNTTLEANNSLIGKVHNAATTLASSIENMNGSSTDSSSVNIKDYSSEFAQVIKEVQGVYSCITPLQGLLQTNISAIKEVAAAVSAVENSVKSQQGFASMLPILQNIAEASSASQNFHKDYSSAMGEVVSSLKAIDSSIHSLQQDNASVDTSAISQAVISGVDPLISKLDDNSSIYQNYTDNLAKNLLSLQQSVDSLKKSTDNNINSMGVLQNSLSSAYSTPSSDSSNNSLSQLTGAVQSLVVTVGSIQSINKGNSVAIGNLITSIKAVESAVKSMQSGNSYDIDINQQGFIVQKKSDADLIARNTVSALQSGLGNGGV